MMSRHKLGAQEVSWVTFPSVARARTSAEQPCCHRRRAVVVNAQRDSHTDGVIVLAELHLKNNSPITNLVPVCNYQHDGESI